MIQFYNRQILNKPNQFAPKKFRCTWKLLIEEWWLKKPNEERKITQRIPTQNPKKTKNKIILTKNKNFQSINGLQVVMICKKCQIFSIKFSIFVKKIIFFSKNQTWLEIKLQDSTHKKINSFVMLSFLMHTLITYCFIFLVPWYEILFFC